MLKQSFLLCCLECLMLGLKLALSWLVSELIATGKESMILMEQNSAKPVWGGKSWAEMIGWSTGPYAVLLVSFQMSLIFEKMEDVFHSSVSNVGCSSFAKVTQSCFDPLWAALVLSEHAVTWSKILHLARVKSPSPNMGNKAVPLSALTADQQPGIFSACRGPQVVPWGCALARTQSVWHILWGTSLCWRGNCGTGWHSQHRKTIQEEINGCRNPNTYLSVQGTHKTKGKKEEHKFLDIVLLTMIKFIRLCWHIANLNTFQNVSASAASVRFATLNFQSAPWLLW